MKENYNFEKEVLIIQDPDLEIAIHVPFSPKQISGDFSIDPEMVIKKDEKGAIFRAYFETGGLLEGQSLTYYPDGFIQMECYYQKGKLHGPSRFYSGDHVLLSETWYYQGRREGKTVRRYLSGALSSIERYKEGKLHGKQEYYYETGTVKTLMHYFHGKLDGEVILFWPSGLKKRELTFQKGVRHGVDQMWDSGGVLIHA